MYRTAVSGCCRLLLGPSPRQQCLHRLSLYRVFHTTPNNHVNPIVWMVVRPLARGAAMLTGRAVRKWWAGLPPNKRDSIAALIYRHRISVYVCGSGLLFGSILFYENNKQVMPITGKRKFVLLNTQQLKQLADVEFQGYVEQFEGKFVMSESSLYSAVMLIVKRLVDSNQEYRPIRDIPWKLFIVDDPSVNAFVLPGGQIFVFTGLLDYFNNLDQVAVILGHEMAHAVLNHAAVQVSYNYIVDIVGVVLLWLVWALLPTDILSVLGHWVQGQLVKILFHLPYNRALEQEADEVGTLLAAKACFDVRESSAIWSQMALEGEVSGEQPVELLATHPSHNTRASHMTKLLPYMLKLRVSCGCEPLTRPDPNTTVQSKRTQFKHTPWIYADCK